MYDDNSLVYSRGHIQIQTCDLYTDGGAIERNYLKNIKSKK